MKKTILLFIFFVTYTFMFSQVEDNAAPKIGEYEEVVETGLSKDVMWLNLKKWVSTNFNNYRYVVDLEDKDAGLLIIKWSSPFAFDVSSALKMTASATYQVDVKDGKYRLKVSDTNVKVDPSISNSEYKSTNTIKQEIKDLEFVVEVSSKYFKSSPIWHIDNDFHSIVESFESELNSIPKYKNEKKKKFNGKWEEKHRELSIIKEAMDGWIQINSSVVKSLIENISEIDDF